LIDCNEWKTEKRHECANVGKVKRLELWWQLYRTSFPVRDLENFRPMDFCSTVYLHIQFFATLTVNRKQLTDNIGGTILGAMSCS